MKYKTLMENSEFTNSSTGSNADFRDGMLKLAKTPMHKKVIKASYFMETLTAGRLKSDIMLPTFKGKKQNFQLNSVTGVVKDGSFGIIIITRLGKDFFWEYVIF